jgi:PucR C-terminal helix-turn-helix domain/GGDEF-like domain
MVRGSLERARVELAERLRARRGEIEEALLTRTYAIADPAEAADPEYEQGLRAAVSAALDYGLDAVECGEERAPEVPILLLAQARLAARNGIPLDTVLRRYFAGYTLLGDYVVQEAGAVSLKEPWLKRLLRDQAAQFDQFLATVGEEYGREEQTAIESTEERRAARVERLLAGELLDTSGLAYDFSGWHLGVVASGADPEQAVRALAAGFDCRLLLLRREEGAIWAWLGARRRLDPADLLRIALAKPRENCAIAIGEPGEGLSGWRLTHRQAAAALPVVLHREEPAARYVDVALLASALNDDLLVASMRRSYLEPLQSGRDGGRIARETLHAYFQAGRNVSSAAAILRASRNTVGSRLRAIEAAIGHPLSDCAAELELALALEALAAA